MRKRAVHLYRPLSNFYFIGNSDGFPMKQKGCALARVEDVALQPCSARKVFKPLMIEVLGELMWACPLCSVFYTID